MPRSATTNKKRQQPKGFSSGIALVMTVIFLTIMMILVTYIYSRTNSNVETTSKRINDQAAVEIGEAGIERSVWCLNNPSNTSDCPNNPNYTGETNVSFGGGTFTSTVSGSGNSRTIDVVATKTGSGGTTSKHLQVTLTTTTANVAFQYGMQTGVGGLTMKNNNKITGNVYSNGSVTGTKSLITGDVVLAVSAPAIDQQSDPSVNPLNYSSIGKTATTLWLAQSFVPSINEKVYAVDLKVAKAGTPPAATMYIYSDNGGKPGTSLYSQALSGPTDASGWENGWTQQLFSTSSSPQLSVSTTYWIVLKVNSTGNATNYWKVVRDTVDTGYTSGSTSTSTDGSTWTGAGYDSAFRIYLGGIPTTLSVNCNGSLCSDGNGIGGNAFAGTISDTNIKQHACYSSLSGTVQAGNGGSTCSGASTGAVPCDATNTIAGTGPYCHPNNPDQSPAEFPLSTAQISQMEAQATAGGTLTGNQTLTDNQTIGPKKIIGDLTITAGSGTPAKLTGTVWVSGNIYLNGTLKLDSNYGTNSGTLIADDPTDLVNSGRIIVGSAGSLLGNSNSNTYIMGLSMSTSLDETAAAIDVSNNLTAGVVYAANGAVNIQNSADIKEVTAQKIIMQNNTTITYQTGLASVVFTSGPGASWIYQAGSYQIIN